MAPLALREAEKIKFLPFLCLYHRISKERVELKVEIRMATFKGLRVLTEKGSLRKGESLVMCLKGTKIRSHKGKP